MYDSAHATAVVMPVADRSIAPVGRPQYDEALDNVNKAIALEPNNAEYFYLRSTCLQVLHFVLCASTNRPG